MNTPLLLRFLRANDGTELLVLALLEFNSTTFRKWPPFKLNLRQYLVWMIRLSTFSSSVGKKKTPTKALTTSYRPKLLDSMPATRGPVGLNIWVGSVQCHWFLDKIKHHGNGVLVRFLNNANCFRVFKNKKYSV